MLFRNNGVRLIASALVVCGLLIGCGEDPSEQETPPDILIICIDALRADHLGCYGYHRETSPNIDELSKRSLVFETTWSSSSWTKSAVPSLFTGLHPSEHRVFEGSHRDTMNRITSDVLDGSHETMAEALKKRGYRTAAFIKNAQLKGFLGFDQGFDLYEEEAGDAFEIVAAGKIGNPDGLDSLSTSLEKVITAKMMESIRIENPVDGDIVSGDPLLIEGSVGNEIVDTMAIDGVPVDIIGGRFSYQRVKVNEGSLDIEVKIEDRNGIDEIIPLAITIDRSSPLLFIDEPSGEKWTKSPIRISGRAEDISKLDLTLDEEPLSLDGSNWSTELAFSDGEHDVTVRAEDEAGLFNSVPLRIKVDSTAPVVAIHDFPDTFYTRARSVTVRGKATDATSGVASLDTNLSSAGEGIDLAEKNTTVPDEDGTFEAVIPIADEGRYAVKVTARDEAGNETVMQRTVVCDRTAPRVKIVRPSEGKDVAVGNLRVQGSVSDISQISLKVNNVTAEIRDGESWVAEVPVTLSTRTIWISGYDSAGNKFDTIYHPIKVVRPTLLASMLDEPLLVLRFKNPSNLVFDKMKLGSLKILWDKYWSLIKSDFPFDIEKSLRSLDGEMLIVLDELAEELQDLRPEPGNIFPIVGDSLLIAGDTGGRQKDLLHRIREFANSPKGTDLFKLSSKTWKHGELYVLTIKRPESAYYREFCIGLVGSHYFASFNRKLLDRHVERHIKNGPQPPGKIGESYGILDTDFHLLLNDRKLVTDLAAALTPEDELLKGEDGSFPWNQLHRTVLGGDEGLGIGFSIDASKINLSLHAVEYRGGIGIGSALEGVGFSPRNINEIPSSARMFASMNADLAKAVLSYTEVIGLFFGSAVKEDFKDSFKSNYGLSLKEFTDAISDCLHIYCYPGKMEDSFCMITKLKSSGIFRKILGDRVKSDNKRYKKGYHNRKEVVYKYSGNNVRSCTCVTDDYLIYAPMQIVMHSAIDRLCGKKNPVTNKKAYLGLIPSLPEKVNCVFYCDDDFFQELAIETLELDKSNLSEDEKFWIEYMKKLGPLVGYSTWNDENYIISISLSH